MKTYPDLTRQERIHKIMGFRRQDLCLVLENLHEATNIAAILRTAESFGVGKICVIHSKTEKPKISRNAASGAGKWLSIDYFSATEECLKSLKAQGFTIVGALVDPGSAVLWEQSFTGRVAVLVGNEAFGMSEEAKQLVDKNIYLPMFGLTESLNVSVAAGIFLYEVIRQKEKGK